MAAIPPHHFALAATGDRHGGDHAHHGGADGVRRDLYRHRRGPRYRDRDSQSLRLSQIFHRIVDRLWLNARRRASGRNDPDFGRAVRVAESEMMVRRVRIIAVFAISLIFLLAWVFPI